MNNVNILMVRHGQTFWNCKKIIQGHLDSRLTTKGRLQSINLATKLKKIKYDVLISSDLGRTKETAQILSLITNQPILEFLPDFRERYLGAIQGLSKKEIYKYYPKLCNNNGDLIHIENIYGIEPRKDFINRIMNGIKYLAETYGNKIFVIVTHGGVIRETFWCVKNKKIMTVKNTDIYYFKVPIL